MESARSSTIKQTLAIFWRFTKVYRFLFWYATIGSVIAAIVSDILPPLIIALTFNKLQALAAQHQPITFSMVQNYIIAYLAVCIGSLVLWRSQAYTAWKYMIYAKKDIRDYIFNHMQHMDSKFHADRFGGALVSQTNKFISAYEQFVGEFNWNILNGLTAFVTTLIVLLFNNLFYAGVFSIFAVVYIFVIYKQMQKQMPYNMDLSSSESETTAKLADVITNMATVRAFAGEKFEARLFDKQTTQTRDKNLKLMQVQLGNELLSQTGTEIVSVIAFVSGLVSIWFFKAPIGVLYLTLTYTLNLATRLWNFMFILRNLNRQFGDAADMTNILNQTSEIKDPISPEQSRIQRGEICFDKVDFWYPAKFSQPLFQNLNLKIKAGEKIGLVGPSGGGKTTITKLLLRFVDIQAGAITIDGQKIAAITQDDLRNKIAYVSQDPILFHRTLAENISYGDPAASQEAIEAAAKMAHAHEFILQLPEGYQTMVGERGVKLSGGQRQRVAIARAMLKNAPIFILDEATSALDSESEVLIQEALWRLMQNRTTIVIAHRLSTIQKMDRILVLKEGKIVEEGSHRELIHMGGAYAQLWNHQSGGFMNDHVLNLQPQPV